MGVSGLVTNWDMISYFNLQTHLKFLTESCAACGALCFSDQKYLTENDIAFDSIDVLNNMEYFVSHAGSDLYCFQNGVLKIESYDANSEEDYVQVTISYTSNADLFRSPFKSEYIIKHSSCYKWNSYEEQS